MKMSKMNAGGSEGSAKLFMPWRDSSGLLHRLLQQRNHNDVCVCGDQKHPEFCMLVYVDFCNLLTKSFSVQVFQPKVISMVVAECGKGIQ